MSDDEQRDDLLERMTAARTRAHARNALAEGRAWIKEHGADLAVQSEMEMPNCVARVGQTAESSSA